MKNILLTGAAGFIGSNLTRMLLDRGDYFVYAVDNFDPFYPRAVKEQNIAEFLPNERFCFIETDIRDIHGLDQLTNIDAVIHLAAKAGVRPSIATPLLYQDVNIAGTLNLLEFAKARKVPRFIFGSSSSVYGNNRNLPWTEEEKLLPISPYACSKLSDEMLGHVYTHLYGIQFLSLRFFTVYGPAQRPDLAIHKFFRAILEELPLPLYGNGSSARDYTYVDDICQGILLALNYTATLFEIINLGNDRVVALSELLDEIEKVCSKKAIIERLPEQPGDVLVTWANISKAKRLLGYSPKTPLATGLRNFYHWYRTAYNEQATAVIHSSTRS